MVPREPRLPQMSLRFRVDMLLPLGLVLMLLGLFMPWLEVEGIWRPHQYWALGLLEQVGDELWTWDPEHQSLQWWWALPLVYGLAMPALWCSPRGAMRVRVTLGLLCVLGVGEAILLCGLLGPVPHAQILDTLGLGLWTTAAGALLVGLPPVLALGRVSAWHTRWRRRPGAPQACRAIEPKGLVRLPHPLRRLVHAARTLRADLSLVRPFDGEQSGMLVDIVGQLRALDAGSRAHMRDLGAGAEALVEDLAPPKPRHESRIDELLRVDEALTRLEALGLAKGAPAPYR